MYVIRPGAVLTICSSDFLELAKVGCEQKSGAIVTVLPDKVFAALVDEDESGDDDPPRTLGSAS